VRLVRLPVGSARWAAFLVTRRDAVPFHHPAWAEVLTDCYGYPSFVLGLEDDDGALVAGLPFLEVKRLIGETRWISLPFTDSCPPLAPEADGRRLAEALDAERQDHGVGRIELRGPLVGAQPEPGPRPLSHRLALDADPDVVARRFRQSTVRNIRKAERSGLELRHADAESDLTEIFYSMHLETRRRLGAPVQPRRFFRLLWRRMFVDVGLGQVLFAYKGGEPIAAIVLLEWNGTTTYKFGASDPRFWELRPNNLLFAEAIRAACLRGQHTFDFGRTDAAGEGLRRFKIGWGCEEESLEYSVLGVPARRAGAEVPGVVTTVIRRSPAWVTRALGEVFYKYAA
jgi:CelD/BcsL family acetyltransferase involved in cellulose biosynthesis